MTRAFNFSAGPAALPDAVLVRARDELLDYRGRGLSVMEMSHRSAEFIDIAERADANLRALLGLPDDYAVLWLQGGATAQFAMVPLNLLRGRPGADYVNTGAWSTKAIGEARRFCSVNVAASSAADNFASIPERDQWRLDPDAAYVHIALNETIGGVEFHEPPDVGSVPLVADASSTILSRPLDVNRFGVIYAGAQKNLGPAGLTLVIVHRELLGGAPDSVPSMFDWAVHAAADSMSNTPPTYAWYVAGLVLEWIRDEGGLAVMAQRNAAKAAALYAAIDNSNFYSAPVAVPARSWMNVPFTLADAALDAEFLAGAERARLLNLKGHRSVGGMRASLYNAVPQAAVDALIEYMQDFESRRG